MKLKLTTFLYGNPTYRTSFTYISKYAVKDGTRQSPVVMNTTTNYFQSFSVNIKRLI